MGIRSDRRREASNTWMYVQGTSSRRGRTSWKEGCPPVSSRWMKEAFFSLILTPSPPISSSTWEYCWSSEARSDWACFVGEQPSRFSALHSCCPCWLRRAKGSDAACFIIKASRCTCSASLASTPTGYWLFFSYASLAMQSCSEFFMMSLLTGCQAEVPSCSAYCSDENSMADRFVTTSGISRAAVLFLAALGSLCTRKCFTVDFPEAGGPTRMHRITSTDTEPCFLIESSYANCHSRKARSVEYKD